MNRWKKAEEFAWRLMAVLGFGAIFVCFSSVFLLSPMAGVSLILDGFPVIGVPLTVFLSLCAVAYLVLVVAWAAGKVGDKRTQ